MIYGANLKGRGQETQASYPLPTQIIKQLSRLQAYLFSNVARDRFLVDQDIHSLTLHKVK